MSLHTPSLHRLLESLAALLALTLVLTTLLSASVTGVMLFSYHELVMRGADRYAALALIAAVTLLIIGFILIWMGRLWKKSRRVSKRIFSSAPSLALRINRVTNAFMDGLLGQDSDKDC